MPGPYRKAIFLACLFLIAGCTASHEGSHAEYRDKPTAVEPEPGSVIARAALDVLGTPYVYGGNTVAGFDCSGLVQYAHAQAGIRIPRTTGKQYSTATQPARLRIGDVLFFRINGRVSHNGIYVGDGRFIHAPSTGKNVSIGYTDNAYFRKRLAGVRRFTRGAGH